MIRVTRIATTCETPACVRRSFAALRASVEASTQEETIDSTSLCLCTAPADVVFSRILRGSWSMAFGQLIVMAFAVLFDSIVSTTALPSSATTKRL